MTANLDFSSTHGSSSQISPAALGGVAPATQPVGLAAGPISGDFAELLTGHMLKMERQGLAAFATDGIAPGAGLQILPLGKELNVITSDAPMPDLASVAAFARAQGLGDAAVQALFGPISAPAAPSLNGIDVNPANWLSMPKNAAVDSLLSARPSVPQVTANAGPASDTHMATSDVLAQINTAAYLQSNWISPANTAPGFPAAPSAPAAQALPAFVPVTAAAAAPKPTMENVPTLIAAANVAVLAPQVAANAGPTSDADRATSDVLAQINTAAYLQSNSISPANTAPAPPAAPSAPAAQALPAFVPVTAGAAAPKPTMENVPTWIAAANVAVLAPQVGKTLLATFNLSAAEPTSELEFEARQAQAATLSLLMANPEISKRLSQLTATDKPANWSSLLLQASAANKGASQMTMLQDLHLELPAAWSVDDKGTLIVDATPDQSIIMPAPGAAAPSPQGIAFSGAAPTPEATSLLNQAEQRSLQYQQLANRLGEALSQRLLTQIELGQWKMQMRMQPSGLGRIEVLLDMNAGGLNVMFSADSSVTRELIAQGAARLKDSLAEAGMTVANLWINGNASRQSGGNPTPGQAFKETPRTQDQVTDVPVLSAAQVRPAAGASDAAGLDVLA